MEWSRGYIECTIRSSHQRKREHDKERAIERRKEGIKKRKRLSRKKKKTPAPPAPIVVINATKTTQITSTVYVINFKHLSSSFLLNGFLLQFEEPVFVVSSDSDFEQPVKVIII